MTILLIVLGVALAGMTVSGVICYRRFAAPNMLPLAEQDLELCREIVSRGQGVPWVCRHALKTGLCPCQPCEKLERARAREAARERTLERWVETLR